jgi:hypothetical protein
VKSYGCPDCGELVDRADHDIWHCQGRVCQQRDKAEARIAFQKAGWEATHTDLLAAHKKIAALTAEIDRLEAVIDNLRVEACQYVRWVKELKAENQKLRETYGAWYAETGERE